MRQNHIDGSIQDLKVISARETDETANDLTSSIASKYGSPKIAA